MTKNEIRLMVSGVELDVEYYFYEGTHGDYFDAPEPDEVELFNIFVNGVDIMEIIDSYWEQHIIDKIIDFERNK